MDGHISGPMLHATKKKHISIKRENELKINYEANNVLKLTKMFHA